MTHTAISFIHTSDLQLGMERDFLGIDGQALFHDSRLRAIDNLGALARAEGAEFIVVAGDVFEANSLSDRLTGRILEKFRDLPVPVYLLPGNHDPLVADSIFRRTDGIGGVHVITSTEPVTVAEGVEIVGAPWRSKFPVGDLVQEALAPLEPTASIRIGLAHGQVASFGDEAAPGLIDLAHAEERIAEGVIDYLALGDSGRVWFSGAPETTDYHERTGDETGGEHNSGNALVVRVNKTTATDADVEVSEHRIGEWTFDALHAELYSLADVEDFLARLDAYPDKSRTCIKYALSGTLDLTSTRALEVGLAERAPVFTALYNRERLDELYLEPDEEELASLSLGGVGDAALAELLGDVDDVVSRDAAALLFRLSKEAN